MAWYVAIGATIGAMFWGFAIRDVSTDDELYEALPSETRWFFRLLGASPKMRVMVVALAAFMWPAFVWEIAKVWLIHGDKDRNR